MIEWKNLDTLHSFQKLQALPERVSLKEVLAGGGGGRGGEGGRDGMPEPSRWRRRAEQPPPLRRPLSS